jgi:hypothetical protein
MYQIPSYSIWDVTGLSPSVYTPPADRFLEGEDCEPPDLVAKVP